ncbi:MAG TPA: hypothetical protein VLB09_06100, partial [Nitrospiria bacterium]|nr:hypothetical protein [Nitrospiria bacterium]
SRDVLEMNRVVYPEADEHPLHDPRVQVHVEDGRFFLQSTDRRFDLITAEPPPPSVAGVVNLYSREYFELLYDRLAEGGMVTYWLPLHDLSEGSAKAVIRAFCDAFADCSLWHGQWTNLMLMGTRNAGGPVSPDHFMRQWSDPALVDELAALGFERPEQLGALFIGDAGFVQETLPGALPVTDDFPRRIISPSHDTQEMGRLFRLWTDVDAARGRFERSELIGRLWPSETREETLPFFEFQDMINDRWFSPRAGHEVAIEDVHRLLTETPLKVPILWLLGSSGDAQRVLEEVEAIDRENPQFYYHQGIRELSERNFPEAARLFEKAEIQESLRVKAFRFRVYATAMAGRLEEAKKLSRDGLEAYLREHFEDLRARGVAVPETYELTLPPFWAWMKQELGIDPAADFLKEKKPGKGGFSP